METGHARTVGGGAVGYEKMHQAVGDRRRERNTSLAVALSTGRSRQREQAQQPG